MAEQTVPCKLCGQPTRMLGTNFCDRCWELSTRIERDQELSVKILRLLGRLPSDSGHYH